MDQGTLRSGYPCLEEREEQIKQVVESGVKSVVHVCAEAGVRGVGVRV